MPGLRTGVWLGKDGTEHMAGDVFAPIIRRGGARWTESMALWYGRPTKTPPICGCRTLRSRSNGLTINLVFARIWSIDH